MARNGGKDWRDVVSWGNTANFGMFCAEVTAYLENEI